jgi:hypothetical protein
MDSPHVSRQWNHPIEAIGPMKHQRLNRLSNAERAELNRKLNDAVEACQIHTSLGEIGSPIVLFGKLMARLDCALTTVVSTRSRVKALTRFRAWTK